MKKINDQGLLDTTEQIVLLITGSGLKEINAAMKKIKLENN